MSRLREENVLQMSRLRQEKQIPLWWCIWV